jgi:5'-nucleotidase
MRRLMLSVLLGLSGLGWAQQPITITFLHKNDLHAHIEPTSVAGKSYGGYARLQTLLARFRSQDPNPVVLNSGDTFQGTLYFNVYEGLADVALLNAMGLAAHAVGNHEFDKGPAPLAAFAKAANFPLVAANLDVSEEAALKDLVKPSVVVTVGGQRLGIVGAITDELLSISMPGPTVKLKPLAESVQQAVDALTAQGVNKIVLLSHLGFEKDLELVRKLKDVDLVIGGHSHTPLGLPDLPGFPRSQGSYPTRAKDGSGVEVPVFQAWEWGKVLGRFKADFDAEGKLVRIHDAAPVVVDETVPEDPVAAGVVQALKKPIQNLQNQPIGETKAEIPRDRLPGGERLMGNLIADAMLAATSRQGAVAAFTNAGGVRSAIDAGPITYGEAISVLPFNNTLVILDVTGEELFQAIAHGAERGGMLLPSRGTSYTVQGGKVVSVTVAGAPLDRSKVYRICLNSFTAQGGDGHQVLRDAKGRRVDTGIVDIDAFVDFIKANSPLDLKPEGRIKSD